MVITKEEQSDIKLKFGVEIECVFELIDNFDAYVYFIRFCNISTMKTKIISYFIEILNYSIRIYNRNVEQIYDGEYLLINEAYLNKINSQEYKDEIYSYIEKIKKCNILKLV